MRLAGLTTTVYACKHQGASGIASWRPLTAPLTALCIMILQGQIRKLEPLLAALAAVPWIDPSAEDGQRVPYIKNTVLDQVEGMGERRTFCKCRLHCGFL